MMHVGVSCAHDYDPALGVGRIVRGIEYGLLLSQRLEQLTFYGMSDDAKVKLSARFPDREIGVRGSSNALRCGAFRVFWEQVVLPRLCTADNLDLLHATAYSAPIDPSVPQVVTVHDVLSITHRSFCRTRNVLHHRAVMRRAVHASRRVIVTSEHVREEVSRCFGVELARVCTVHPGIAPEFFEASTDEVTRAARLRHGLPEKYLLWLGSNEPKKNLPRLLCAVALLRERGVEIPLVVAGAKGWAPALKVAALNVLQLGWVPDQDLPALYQCAQALVFPSLAEGWGLPVSEAMASGTPVVCSAIPSAMESDAKAALVVDPYSVVSIADGIERVLTDGVLRHELIARGKRAASQLTWARHAERLWEIYAAAMQG